MSYSIQRHIAYNAWANTRTAEVLRLVNDDIFLQETGSSFPSIAKTITHISQAQGIWLQRMRGESTSIGPSGNSAPCKQEILDRLIRSSHDLVVFVTSMEVSFLRKTYAYKSLKGESFENSFEETLYHVVNHSTYHRGQVITMLRQAGVTSVVGTDLIHYLRGLKQ